MLEGKGERGVTQVLTHMMRDKGRGGSIYKIATRESGRGKRGREEGRQRGGREGEGDLEN